MRSVFHGIGCVFYGMAIVFYEIGNVFYGISPVLYGICNVFYGMRSVFYGMGYDLYFFAMHLDEWSLAFCQITLQKTQEGQHCPCITMMTHNANFS